MIAKINDVQFVSSQKVLDIYYDTEQPEPTVPIMWLPGGAWQFHDEDVGVSLEIMKSLVPHGYTVFAVRYLRAPVYKLWAIINSCWEAYRFIQNYPNVIPEKTILSGGSAGGYLALLAGVREAWGAGIVAFYAPTNLTNVATEHWNPSWLPDLLGGANPAHESPANYGRNVPTLLVHGEQDEWVKIEQSIWMHQALTAAGAPVELWRVNHAGHCLQPRNGPISPSIEETEAKVLEFCNYWVKE